MQKYFFPPVRRRNLLSPVRIYCSRYGWSPEQWKLLTVKWFILQVDATDDSGALLSKISNLQRNFRGSKWIRIISDCNATSQTRSKGLVLLTECKCFIIMFGNAFCGCQSRRCYRTHWEENFIFVILTAGSAAG